MNKRGLAISQILLLIIGVISFAYAFSGIGFVSASGEPTSYDDYGHSGSSPVPGDASTSMPAKAGTGTPQQGPAGNGETGGGLVSLVGGFIKGNLNTIITNAGIAFAISMGIKFLLPLLFPSISEEVATTAAWLGGTGYFLGSTFLPMIFEVGAIGGGLIGVGVALLCFALFYKVEDQSIVAFTCYSWQPESGGADCHKCGSDLFPCTEYQCRSLGRSCELLNEGTDEELCAYVDRNDVKPPTIEAWDDALNEGYSYTPLDAMLPPDRGVKIIYDSEDGCALPYDRVSLGVELDKPARCRIDKFRRDSFEDMMQEMSGGLDKYNHSIEIPLPGPDELKSEGIFLENGGNFELYVRCQSRNEISNVGSFVFKYCVQEGPDYVAPTIEFTDPLSGMPIGNGVGSIDARVYVNKPSDCKWSRSDKDYENMENEMTCAKSVFDMETNTLYKCETTLTGLRDGVENIFYLKCKSYPLKQEEDRYAMKESYVYSLIGTQPLVIDWVKPEETIRGASESVKVTLEAKTSAGYNNGAAVCEFGETSDNKADDKFTPFWTHQHSYDLWLGEGSYEYFIRCCDLGNNCEIKTVEFDVETDFDAPLVIRVYYEGGDLNLITSEPAQCVYDTTSCTYNLEDGISIISSDDIIHFMSWNTNSNLYVKCLDEYGNQPAPNECSIILRPFEFF